MVEQRGVGVHHPLGRAGRARGVDDRQRVRAVDIVFHRRQQRLIDGLGEPMESSRSKITCRNCGAATSNSGSPESKAGARQYLGQPLHVVVRAERRRSKQDFGVAVDELLA